MTNRSSLPRRKWLWPAMMPILSLLMHTIPATADEPATGQQAPSVFRPDEIQHGFAEYDTPPNFSFDGKPAPYDSYSQAPSQWDEKPGGVFQELNFAESIEEERTIRRGHIYVPVNPTTTFSPDSPSVYLVFAVHKHLSSYQIIGRLFREHGTEIDTANWIDEDIVELATEDESGFLKFFTPGDQWQPGTYRVDIYVGYMANPNNKMGTMRFTVTPAP